MIEKTINKNNPVRLGVKTTMTAFGLFLALGVHFSQAGELDSPAEEVIVSAARVPTNIDDVGNAVTVITAEDLNRRQVRTLPEALTLTPGLSVTQLGGQGRQTSIFTRGADANQTLLLIDGQPYGDPSTPDGNFNIGNLTVGDIDRIEIVRGAQSAVYGSQAGAGVINIITAKPQDATPHGSAFVEGGSFGTVNERGQVSSKIGDKVGVTATFDHVDTDGTDITPPRYRGGLASTDAPYRNSTGSLTVTGELTDQLSARLYGQAIESHSATAPTPEDPNAVEKLNRYYGSGALAGHFFEDAWKPTLTVSATQTTTHDQNTPDFTSSTASATRNQGSRRGLTFVNEINVIDHNKFVIGLDAVRNTLSSSGITDFGGFVINEASSAVDHAWGVYAEDIVDYGRFGGTAGFRIDEPEGYMTKGTWHVSPVVKFDETGTKLKASIGTGFKTPSLFQRFGFEPNNFGSAFVGNPTLKPETTRSWEGGFEQQIAGDRLSLGATYFQLVSDNAASTVFDTFGNSTTVNNVFERSKGVETFVTAKPWNELIATINYTYTEAVDRSTGSLLLRRPRHKVDIQATYTPIEPLRLTGIVRYVGRQQDIGLFGGTVYDSSYTTADLTGSYDITSNLEVFSRVTNLLNRRYETADGFAGSGRAGFVGLKAKF